MKDLAMMYAMAAIMGDGLGMPNRSGFSPQKISGELPPKPMPKGCKEYFFNAEGGFSTEKMLHSELVFKCYALNHKSAKKKFQKWLNSEQNPEGSDTSKAQ
jgi:hypothetical protein